MLLIQKEENMTKVQANNIIYYYELISKSSVEIMGIRVSMRKQHNFETKNFPLRNMGDTVGRYGRGGYTS